MLNDDQVEEIVVRSYQYVALYNVNNKFAITQDGWNTIQPDTILKDHTMQDIARPNNDTLYIGAMLDLRKEPIILDIPAFDSKYVSLMVTAYDHYVNTPMTTRKGDFAKPEKVLFYSARTEGYSGEPLEGVDRLFEASGDFISAVFRVMPHTNETERFEQIKKQMQFLSMRSRYCSQVYISLALLIIVGTSACSKTDFSFLNLMPAPEVYSDEIINPFLDPTLEKSSEYIFYATDRKPDPGQDQLNCPWRCTPY